MKRFLTFLLAILTIMQVFAATYPATMYIKSDWDNNGTWTWHTMTTKEDGVYTYKANWNSNYGCNINTSKSDDNSLWFKYNKIVGYDPTVLQNGLYVVFTYSASDETLFVYPESASSVCLIFSQPTLIVGQSFTMRGFVRNISGAMYSYKMTDPDGIITEVAGGQNITPSKAGTYTFEVTATPAPGNANQKAATCTITREVIRETNHVFTSSEKKRAYYEDPATHDITFVFDPATWGRNFSSTNSVSVSGSFNGWSTSAAGYELVKDTKQQLFYVTVPYNKVKRPGNIGQPEFKFVINGNYSDPYSGYPSDYVYNSNGNRNMMVVFSFDDLTEVRNTITTASVLKKVSDFDLSVRSGKEEISNYRTVPGTINLKRCYHPFKSTSRTDMSTEPLRMEYVNKLAQEDGVCNDITLSEDETENLGSYTANGKTYQESIPAYYKTMLDEGHVLFVGKGYSTPSYNEVYYNNRAEKFNTWIKQIVDFMNNDNNKGAFTIHCRLGTDRTGMFCATLAALCGAQWDEIAVDYQKSNRMGVNEYRSAKLLKYAFEYMLEADDLSEVVDFPGAVQQHFINDGVFTADDIKRLQAKLNNQLVTGVSEVSADTFTVDGGIGYVLVNAPGNVEVYTASGQKAYSGNAGRISLPAGLYIVCCDNHSAKVLVK